MKDSGLPVPRWALLSAAAAPPILTFDEPSLELISRTDSQNASSPEARQLIGGDMCSPEGQWNCMTTSWQRCASGVWTGVVPCATGTICQPFGLTDYITIEYEAAANNGHAEDGGRAGRAGSDDSKSGKKSFGLRKAPSLMLLFTAFATGVSWSFLV
ncbi:hypothetical protein ACHAQJ_007474 [Trichoderma viride]